MCFAFHCLVSTFADSKQAGKVGSFHSQWDNNDPSLFDGRRRAARAAIAGGEENRGLRKRVSTSQDSGVPEDMEPHSYTPSHEEAINKPPVLRANPVVPFMKRRGGHPPKGGQKSPVLNEKTNKCQPWQESSLAKTMERSHGLVSDRNKPIIASTQTKNVDSARQKRRDHHQDLTHPSPRRKHQDSPTHSSSNRQQDVRDKSSSSAAQFYLSHSRYTPLTSNKPAFDSHHDRVGFGSRAPRFSQEAHSPKKAGPVKKGDVGMFGDHLPTVVGRSTRSKALPENAIFGHKANMASITAG